MTIKHLVLSGGGPLGFQYIGALQILNEKLFWNINDIISIYATSVGAIVGSILCLNYDWETLNKYLIERPWHEIFTLSGKQIVEAYYNKGLYDKKIIEIAFKPLLEAKNLSLSITLKEFFLLTKIDLHLFSFELNSFKTIEINYLLFPDLSLITAISMSCAIPGIFMPICNNNECFMDGAVMANYPLSYCLNNNTNLNLDEILGFTYCIKKDYNKDLFSNIKNIIDEESSILEYILNFSTNAINFITNSIKAINIPNEIVFHLAETPLSFEFIKNSIYSIEKRKEFIEKGYLKAQEFLDILHNGQAI
jgi:predicted acylesterase/phospholipase RssA